MKNNVLYSCLVPYCIVFSVFILFSGCAAKKSDPVPATDKFSLDILEQYQQTDDPLTARRLTSEITAAAAAGAPEQEVTIIVHPAYSVFFRDTKKTYSDAKYSLLRKQFDSEADVIRDQGLAGKTVILIVPGNYPADSVAPLAYTSYLNIVTGRAQTVYYVLSETSSSGGLPMDEMVNLYGFIHALKAKKVLIGGGYIGRCQREFYTQLTNYLDSSMTAIVPEISTISPDDITDEDAMKILIGIEEDDYTPVKKFIDRKTSSKANVKSRTPKKNP